MRYIEAPAELGRDVAGPVLFLAGGITDCPDWQAEAAAMLRGEAGLTVVNPRRAVYDEDVAVEQITWEHTHLHRAGLILFWFTSGSLQPIALYELGVHVTRGAPIVVGADPDYPRRLDVEVQLSLARPGLPVHRTLAATVAAARDLLG